MMFNNFKPIMTPYPYLPRLENGELDDVTENDWVNLNKVIESALTQSGNDEMGKALLAGQKLAVLYGVPGMLKYCDAAIMIYDRLASQGEEIEMMSINLLGYLLLAEKLYEINSACDKDAVKNLLPELSDKAAIWTERRANIIRVGGIDGYQKQAELDAAAMLESMKVTKTKSSNPS